MNIFTYGENFSEFIKISIYTFKEFKTNEKCYS